MPLLTYHKTGAGLTCEKHPLESLSVLNKNKLKNLKYNTNIYT